MTVPVDPAAAPMTAVRRYGPPVVILAVTIGFLVMALQLRGKSGEVPVLIGVVTLVLVALDIVTRTRTGVGRRLRDLLNPDCFEATGIVEDDMPVRREAVAIGWIAAFAALILVAGFMVAIPVYLAAYMLAARTPVLRTAIVTAAFSLGVWLLFDLALGFRLYGGLLLG